MSAVEIPPVPNTITLQDVDALRALRQKHEQELRDYEEETRRQRRNLRKLKRTLADKGAVQSAPDRTQDVKQAAEQQLAEEHAKKVALEAERAKAAEMEAERERVETEAFLLERARLEERLLKIREQRQQEERWIQDRCANEVEENQSDAGSEVVAAVVGGKRASEANSFCSAEELVSTAPSAVPSCTPSVVSSAAPSRSSSPTGSDVTGRCPQIPIAVVASAVEYAEVGVAGQCSVGLAGKGSAASVASAAPAPTPRKGGGKGKGKGTAPIPPPPISTPRLSLPSRVAARPSRFVNLYWKATQKPEVVDLQAFENDPFLARLRDPDPSPEDALLDASTLNLPPKIHVPALPETIFSSGLEVPEFPEEMLEAYFKRSEAVVRLPQVDSMRQNQDTAGRTNHIGDQKRLNMIGIMLQKHVMEHKEDSNREAILNIKRGVLQCDFDMVRLECLSVIRTVLRQHVKDGNPLCSFAQTHGEAAIWDLAYPEHHYLVYELSKVPQIDARLECMLFQLGFCENMATCRQNLDTLFKALEALQAKRDLIRRFFVTAHRLGQSLSQRPSRGFQLSTLEKLTQTKSTKMPSLSILHFVLALMSREDAQDLFTDDDIALLRSAKALGTSKVCDECRELAQGLYGVKQICESGEYTCQSTGHSVRMERRRKTLPPRAAALALSGEVQEPQEPAIDTDDCFHQVMQNFVDSHADEADEIAVECHKMLLLYKELALFFDDLNNVYPPPKDPSDKKLDLVDVFYRFAKVVPQHRQDVEDEGLRGKIGNRDC